MNRKSPVKQHLDSNAGTQIASVLVALSLIPFSLCVSYFTGMIGSKAVALAITGAQLRASAFSFILAYALLVVGLELLCSRQKRSSLQATEQPRVTKMFLPSFAILVCATTARAFAVRRGDNFISIHPFLMELSTMLFVAAYALLIAKCLQQLVGREKEDLLESGERW